MAGAKAAVRRVNSRSERTNEYAAASYGKVRVRTRTRSRAAASSGRTAARKGAGAAAICRGYIIFLALISIMTVGMCVYYLNLKTKVGRQVRANASLRTELMTMRAENDALYADIENSVNLNKVREEAMDRYGMNYATQDQIVWYNRSDSGYVRQYQSLPSD